MLRTLLTSLSLLGLAACATGAGGLNLPAGSEATAAASPEAAGRLARDVCLPALSGADFVEASLASGARAVSNPASALGGFPDQAYVFADAPRVFAWNFGAAVQVGTPKTGCTLAVFDGDQQAALDAISNALDGALPGFDPAELPPSSALTSSPVFLRADGGVFMLISSDEQSVMTANGPRVTRTRQGFLMSIYKDSEDAG